MANRVLQLKQHYGNAMTKLINESFALGSASQHHEGQMSEELQERLSSAEVEKIRAAEAALWTENARDRLRSRYEELDVEKRAAIEEARLAAEEELAPKDVTTESVLMATRMSEQDLIDSMDAAAGLGDVGRETIKLCLAMARKKDDYAMAIDHALELLPDLKDAYDDTLMAAEEPEFNDEPASWEFDQYAAKAPSAQDILAAPLDDRNAYNRMR